MFGSFQDAISIIKIVRDNCEDKNAIIELEKTITELKRAEDSQRELFERDKAEHESHRPDAWFDDFAEVY